MLHLSKDDLDTIGELILWDYEDQIGHFVHPPMDIERFANDYLGLAIHHETLSKSGSILGLTTSEGVFIELESHGESCKALSFPKNSILLDERLLHEKNKRRRRFTIAHECAHQILARIEDNSMGIRFRKGTRSGNDVARRFSTEEDWSEWQANTLGAALLMPNIDVRLQLVQYQFLNGYPGFRSLTHARYEHLMAYLTDAFDVSKTAMRIRLQEIGLLAKA